MLNLAINVNSESQEDANSQDFPHKSFHPCSDQFSEQDTSLLMESRFVKLFSIPMKDLISQQQQQEQQQSLTSVQTALDNIRIPVFDESINHRWHALRQLIDLNQNRESLLEVWYRLNVVDLDLKQASKIPQ